MKNICFHLNRKLWVTMALLLSLAFPGIAQKITVHGYVDDELGEPLIGATVMEKRHLKRYGNRSRRQIHVECREECHPRDQLYRV